MAVFYVTKNGKDNNPGDELDRSILTIGRALKVSKPDDIILIGPGVYNEVVKIETPRLTLRALDPENWPVLDGRYTPAERLSNGNMPPPNAKKSYLPGSDYGKMLEFVADDVTVDGIVIRNVAGQPVGIRKNRARLLNAILTHAYGGGLVAENVTAPLIQNVEMTHCNQKRYDPTNTKGGPAKVQVNLLFKRVIEGVVRRCTIACNHGEGIALAMDSQWCVIEGNRVHTNLHMQIVINHAQNNIIRGNFVYHTNHPDFVQRKSGNPPTGIIISDENQRGQKHGLTPSSGNIIVNNIVTGTGQCFTARISNNANGALRKTYVGYNTFVEAAVNDGTPINIRIPAGGHSDSVFENNIIVQTKGTIARILAGSGVLCQNNLWSKKPPNQAAGAGDVVGDPLIDPDVKLDDATDPASFAPRAGSPAAGKGLARPMPDPGKLPIPAVTADLLGRERPNFPTIGALEVATIDKPEEPQEPGDPTPEPEPQPEPQPEPTWMNELDERQQAFIAAARIYRDTIAPGFPGHQLILLLADVADIADELEAMGMGD